MTGKQKWNFNEGFQAMLCLSGSSGAQQIVISKRPSILSCHRAGYSAVVFPWGGGSELVPVVSHLLRKILRAELLGVDDPFKIGILKILLYLGVVYID